MSINYILMYLLWAYIIGMTLYSHFKNQYLTKKYHERLKKEKEQSLNG